MYELIVWVIVHLGAWGMMLLAAAGFGHLFLRKYQFDSLLEKLVFTLSLGLGLSALLIFALGLLGLLYVNVIFTLTVAGALGTTIYLLRLRKGEWFGRRPAWPKIPSLRTAAIGCLIAMAVAYWCLLLWSTLYPPVHWDAISHHLVLCREYLSAHRLFAVMGIPHPVLPTLNHMLFTWGMAVKDDILAQLIEHTFLMLTALGLYAWGRRAKRPLLGLAVAAFWLGNPLVLWLGESAYVDVCLVGFVFLGVYALRLFWEQREARWWYLAMALLGMGAGVKLPGLFFIIVGVGLGFWVMVQSRITWKPFARRRQQKEPENPQQAPPQFTFQSFMRGCLVAFILGIPWYAYIFYYTGNPIWPTFPEFSRGDWGAPDFVRNLNNWMKNAAEPRTLVNFLLLPVDWIRYPSRFYAETNLTLFPLIIAWPLAWVIALWNRSVRWWVLWALGFTFYWFLFPHQLRYWLPALPLAGLALYESLGWLMEKISKAAILHSAVWITLTVAAMMWGGRGIHGEIKAKGFPPTNAKARETFLLSMGGYKGVKYVNKQANEDDTVCILNASYLNYYFKTQVLDVFSLLQSGRIPSFRWPDDEQWVRYLETRKVTWIFVNHANAPDYLKIPKQNLVLNPIWPDFQLVYADSVTWVFRRRPVPPEIGWQPTVPLFENFYAKEDGNLSRAVKSAYALPTGTADLEPVRFKADLCSSGLRNCFQGGDDMQ
jgi:hypothetical protein